MRHRNEYPDMRKIIALLFLLTTLLLAGVKTAPQQKALVLTNLTIIDVSGGPSKPDMTVVITGDRITDLGEAGKVSVPQDGRVIDARGKFLIPGLWDMHVHWYSKDTFTLFLANGVTGIREMFGNSDLVRWQKEIARGSLAGPRMAVASPIIDGPQPIWPTSISVRDEAEGRKAVTRVKEGGADFVKVYSLLTREAYFGIADEARKQGLPFAGHVPFTVTAAEASDAGQKSIEHLSGIIRTRTGAQKESEFFAHFIKNGTWQCPTLTVLRSNAYRDDPNFRNDERLKFVPRNILERWDRRMDGNRFGENSAQARRLFQKGIEVVGNMNRAGVLILAGTDTGNPFCFPGFSLHDELALLVNAGLTPTESLRTATLNPAKFFGREQTLGTVEQGKLADLVLLEANPLEDIRNTQKIAAVIMNGRFYDRKALDKMLSQAQTLANQR
jgi:imidazolonepropionase-like amidohydrolase